MRLAMVWPLRLSSTRFTTTTARIGTIAESQTSAKSASDCILLPPMPTTAATITTAGTSRMMLSTIAAPRRVPRLASTRSPVSNSWSRAAGAAYGFAYGLLADGSGGGSGGGCIGSPSSKLPGAL